MQNLYLELHKNDKIYVNCNNWVLGIIVLHMFA